MTIQVRQASPARQPMQREQGSSKSVGCRPTLFSAREMRCAPVLRDALSQKAAARSEASLRRHRQPLRTQKTLHPTAHEPLRSHRRVWQPHVTGHASARLLRKACQASSARHQASKQHEAQDCPSQHDTVPRERQMLCAPVRKACPKSSETRCSSRHTLRRHKKRLRDTEPSNEQYTRCCRAIGASGSGTRQDTSKKDSATPGPHDAERRKSERQKQSAAPWRYLGARVRCGAHL